MTSLRGQIAMAAQRLAAAGVPSPRPDAEVLAAHVLGVDRRELLLAPPPGASFEAEFAAVVARRERREPLQHITGVAPFRHIDLQVGPGVFVPRPETELTAGVAVDAAHRAAKWGQPPVVVDLYAGSGAIALSVAHEVPQARVHAVELDEGAVDWLRRNAEGRPVTVHHADVADCLRDLDGMVDVVAANPPYIPEGARIRDPEVAAHDPAPALWSGRDGLDAMRVLERVAARLLKPAGIVVAEHADAQAEAAPAVFVEAGRWSQVTDHTDLAGRPRYLTAVRTDDRSSDDRSSDDQR